MYAIDILAAVLALSALPAALGQVSTSISITSVPTVTMMWDSTNAADPASIGKGSQITTTSADASVATGDPGSNITSSLSEGTNNTELPTPPGPGASGNPDANNPAGRVEVAFGFSLLAAAVGLGSVLL